MIFFLILNLCLVKASIDKQFIVLFGQNLRKIRESKKISMQSLADTINVEYSQISRIERGLINTSIGIAHSISQALEIDIKELFNFQVEKKSNN
ncbi:helix-turn-helix domain-containing protein [Chryseobacterium chendengshani]|uniref:helix-turn-helix domain-containing protein n=1 Tax=Chryseobacterium sp. LJ668 TaxID=2864040 RepID=UPI001C68CD01|nr:helix-turn-helix transcriptional regulator [Chryseobacterium sp. LJ668]MBW8523915.1 helix-turn-helix domain-containing protein [Chryseobacterium sp. LJ668]QYK16855.1 helix-turn-helix domain-containing protein [Chryseobacterium sp. LJ668]